jgi:hypothetical protein
MKKIISSVLIVSLLALTMFISVGPARQISTQLDESQMMLLVGGMSWSCAIAIASFTLAIVGAAMATGGIAVFVFAQMSLYVNAAGMVVGCIDG